MQTKLEQGASLKISRLRGSDGLVHPKVYLARRTNWRDKSCMRGADDLHQVPVDAVMLTPHMLAAFIARGRGFQAMLAKATKP